MLLKILKATGNRKIGEASYDDDWGIGLSLSNPCALDIDQWIGGNAQGKALMRARDELS